MVLLKKKEKISRDDKVASLKLNAIENKHILCLDDRNSISLALIFWDIMTEMINGEKNDKNNELNQSEFLKDFI